MPPRNPQHDPNTGPSGQVLAFRPRAPQPEAQPPAGCGAGPCAIDLPPMTAPLMTWPLDEDAPKHPSETLSHNGQAVLLASLLTLMSSFAQRAASGQVCAALAWRVERHLAELAELSGPGSLHPVLRETAEQLLADWDQLDQRLAARSTHADAPTLCPARAARPEWLRWILGPAG